MPNYIPHLLNKLNHDTPQKPQRSPTTYITMKPTKKGERQLVAPKDTSTLLEGKMITKVQSIVGALLYYARALDSTMLPALNQIGTQQSAPTINTKRAVNQLLDYANTYKHTRVRFHASDMQLEIDSDAAYLVLPKARSRMAGYFKLLDDPKNKQRTLYNGAILIECRTLRHVVSSAAEAETNSVFQNAKTAIPIRNLLIGMGHPQNATIIKTDNSTTQGFVNKNIQLKRSKSWDMNLHWLRDRETRKHFNIIWEHGKNNKGDYFTKHHPIIHHRKERKNYVKDIVNNMFSNLKNIYETER